MTGSPGLSLVSGAAFIQGRGLATALSQPRGMSSEMVTGSDGKAGTQPRGVAAVQEVCLRNENSELLELPFIFVFPENNSKSRCYITFSNF